MDKFLGKDAYESPYMSGFSRMGHKPKVHMGKSAKHSYQNIAPDKLTEAFLNDLRTKYFTHKLRKVMAYELLMNRVGGDLKRVVERIHDQVNHAKSKEFVIIGGGPRSLSFFTREKRSKGTKRVKALTIEVDVRGYIPDNVLIDTKDKRMSIRAVRVCGTEKVLGILAPSIQALEKLKIHPPKGGLLILQYSDKASPAS